MSRIRMSWEWVGGWPVFVYTRFIDHSVFDVYIVLGKKGAQNDGYNGPNAKRWIDTFRVEGHASKDAVVQVALDKARDQLIAENKYDTHGLGNYEHHMRYNF